MNFVNVTIGGRQYRLACEPGQEQRLTKLATNLEDLVGQLRGKFGEVGDQRLIVMAALTLADELYDARQKISRLETRRRRDDRCARDLCRTLEGDAGGRRRRARRRLRALEKMTAGAEPAQSAAASRWVEGRRQRRNANVVATSPMAVKPAPAKNVAAGPIICHNAPAIRLASNSARPLTKLKTPNAVARRFAGAASATSAASRPCVQAHMQAPQRGAAERAADPGHERQHQVREHQHR